MYNANYKNKIVDVFFFVTIGILFIRGGLFLIQASNELRIYDEYKFGDFKNTIIEEFINNPSKFQNKYHYQIQNQDELSDEIIKDIYYKTNSKKYILLTSVLLPMTISVGILLFLSPIFFLLFIIKNYNKYRLSIDKFDQNKGYYRDLLKKYNPLELSYNNNYILDFYAISAMVLHLQQKNVLYLEDGKFFVNQKNVPNLDVLETQFINNIKISNIGKIEVNYSKLIKLTEQACKKKKLLIMSDLPIKKIVIEMLISIICYVLLSVLWEHLDSILNMFPSINYGFSLFFETLLCIMLFLLVLFLPFFICLKYTVLYETSNIKHPKKTHLGNEINHKLSGLKNFIKDFSVLNDREKEEIILWDDYLIYSVLFGDNKKIYSEIKDKISYIS